VGSVTRNSGAVVPPEFSEGQRMPDLSIARKERKRKPEGEERLQSKGGHEDAGGRFLRTNFTAPH
jgi:hypothetical protein